MESSESIIGIRDHYDEKEGVSEDQSSHSREYE
jgi:hypothetical protein